MTPSLLFYSAVTMMIAGIFSAIHPFGFLWMETPGAGLGVTAASLAVALLALFLPPHDEETADRATSLDQRMPVWQFRERHHLSVDATPERVYQAIQAVRADEILFFRTLVAIRRLGRQHSPGILNPGDRDPLLTVATRTTFVRLADVPPRELLVGTVIMAPREVSRRERMDPEMFGRSTAADVGLAAMNFVVTRNDRGVTVVSTETRIFLNSARAVRNFGIYWRIILPGSVIIRRMWLRAIRMRAET